MTTLIKDPSTIKHLAYCIKEIIKSESIFVDIDIEIQKAWSQNGEYEVEYLHKKQGATTSNEDSRIVSKKFFNHCTILRLEEMEEKLEIMNFNLNK